MLINICMKFHEDTFSGFRVTEWKLFCDGQTDDSSKNNMSPNPINNQGYNSHKVCSIPGRKYYIENDDVKIAALR